MRKLRPKKEKGINVTYVVNVSVGTRPSSLTGSVKSVSVKLLENKVNLSVEENVFLNS